jgi:uncharacterized membrane protein
MPKRKQSGPFGYTVRPMPKTKRTWREVQSSLWFVPSGLILVAAGLAAALVAVDRGLGLGPAEAFPAVFGTEPAASRDILAVVANSMLTAAALVLSMTLVALTLASTQFSPRILGTFMRDRTTQAMIGTFVGIFVYCLLVLRTIREGEGVAFVPTLAVAVGAASGLVGMGALVYFTHHIARSIQASNIIASIAHETLRVVDELYPPGPPAAARDAAALEQLLARRDWIPVPSSETGYIQQIETGGLLEVAMRLGGVVRMECRVGEFVVEGAPLASYSPDERGGRLDGAAAREINDLCALSTTRTIDQDVAFGLRQLVDIALKALSAAVNDTTTGLNCVDYLGAVLAVLARRHVGTFYLSDFGGDSLRLVAKGQTFEDFFDLTFTQIRQNAAGNVAVILRLARTVVLVANAARGGPAAAECRELADAELRRLAVLAELTVADPEDRAKALRHIARFAAACGPASAH